MTRFHGGVEWTAEMMEAFETMAQDHTLSYSEMARQLSTRFGVSLTKNACVGKGRRMGLEVRVPSRVSKVKRPRKVIVVVDAPIAPELPNHNKDYPLDIYQLDTSTCKWPLGKVQDRPPYIYCGQPTELGRSWCPVHHKMAYSQLRKVG